jgi:TetR/AcrR family transcriptional repressor of nem operon
MLDVAERLLQIHGYNGFSYGDVAAELGITRAALHYHFQSKAELGEALVLRYSDRFAAALAALDAGPLDAVAALDAYADLYADVLRTHRMCLCGMLAAEYETLPTAMRRGVSTFFDQNTAWLAAVLERGRRDGSLSFDGPAQDTAAMILGGLEGAMLISRIDADLERFRAAAGRLLAGLVSRGGPATPAEVATG